MKRRLLDLLVCPSCFGSFVLTPDVEERRPGSAAAGYETEVIEGMLACASCGDAYPIINAIPRILDPDLLTRMESRYPDYFARHGRTTTTTASPDALGDTLESFTRQRLDLAPPCPEFIAQWRAHLAKVLGPAVEPGQIEGRLVLDAGCGFGRHIFTAAERGAEVVGMDLSGAVDIAFRNTQHLDRTHIVQTNLYRPPFRNGTFDIVWSFGVLHHLPDPREGFRVISRLARPDGGLVAIWVYGYQGMAFTYRLSHLRPIRRLVAGRSARTKVRASQAIAATLSAAYWTPLRVLDRLGFGRRIERLPLSEQVHHSWSSRVAAVHDRVATPITHYHDRAELEGWFEEIGMADIVVADTNRRGWRASGRRRDDALVRNDESWPSRAALAREDSR
jgi:SAM-dependent methyltransferase